MLSDWLSPVPLVAILRGIKPTDAVATGRALLDAGFRMLEVPLNSPSPLDSIARLAEALNGEALIGAGTVVTPEQVDEVVAVGGRLIVMPHADPAVIGRARAVGAICTPGVATPTEAFAALAAGADALKLFPASTLGPDTLKAWCAVLPPDVMVIPVGGIESANMAAWVAAGAAGFGVGSALYAAGRPLEETTRRAREFARVARELFPAEGGSRA